LKETEKYFFALNSLKTLFKNHGERQSQAFFTIYSNYPVDKNKHDLPNKTSAPIYTFFAFSIRSLLKKSTIMFLVSLGKFISFHSTSDFATPWLNFLIEQKHFGFV